MTRRTLEELPSHGTMGFFSFRHRYSFPSINYILIISIIRKGFVRIRFLTRRNARKNRWIGFARDKRNRWKCIHWKQLLRSRFCFVSIPLSPLFTLLLLALHEPDVSALAYFLVFHLPFPILLRFYSTAVRQFYSQNQLEIHSSSSRFFYFSDEMHSQNFRLMFDQSFIIIIYQKKKKKIEHDEILSLWQISYIANNFRN